MERGDAANPAEDLRAQPRFRLFSIEPPDIPHRCWLARPEGLSPSEDIADDARALAWNQGRLRGEGALGPRLCAEDHETEWGDTDAGMVMSLGVALSARCAAALAELVKDACEFVPVEIEAADGRGEWYLPNPRRTVERVEARRVVRGQRRAYTVVPESAAGLAVFRCLVRKSAEARCVLSRAVCEGLIERGVEWVSFVGVMDEGGVEGEVEGDA